MAEEHFMNQQWKVTDYGLESYVPGAPYEYYIEAHRLLELWTVPKGTPPLYSWPMHLTEKSWINFHMFIEAFGVALKVHAGKYEGEPDVEVLCRSIAKAIKRLEYMKSEEGKPFDDKFSQHLTGSEE